MGISHTLNRFHQQRSALAAALILIADCSHQSAAGATINVTTTQQGVTNGQCSLQEAIYASQFKSNTAIISTSPDVTYTTGCTAGTGDDDIIVLAPGALYAFRSFLGRRQPQYFWADGHADHYLKNHN